MKSHQGSFFWVWIVQVFHFFSKKINIGVSASKEQKKRSPSSYVSTFICLIIIHNMSEDNSQQNGSSNGNGTGNGDVPEIELIIKVNLIDLHEKKLIFHYSTSQRSINYCCCFFVQILSCRASSEFYLMTFHHDFINHFYVCGLRYIQYLYKVSQCHFDTF